MKANVVLLVGLLGILPKASAQLQVTTNIPGTVRYSWVGNSFGGAGSAKRAIASGI